MKKLFVVLTLSFVALMAFAGCGRPRQKSEKVAASDSLDFTPGDTSEHLEISVGFRSELLIGGEPLDREQDKLFALIEDKFNVTLNLKLTVGDYIQKYQLLAASGELPDYFPTFLPDNIFWDWVKQGVIAEIPKQLYENYPNVEALLSIPALDYYSDFLKKHYFIPRTNSASADPSIDPKFRENFDGPRLGMYFRKDWLANLGLQRPKTWDEFVEVMRAFTEDDPDGNGENDTYGMTVRASYELIMLSHVFNTQIWSSLLRWYEKDGSYIPVFIDSKPIEDFLTALGAMYAKGYIDPDVMVLKAGEGSKRFVQGKAGVFLQDAGPIRFGQVVSLWEEANPGKPFFDSVEILRTWPFPNVYTGERINFRSRGYWSGNYFNGDISLEKMDRMLNILNFSNSEEGINLWYRGLEGIDWKMEDGQFVNLLPVIDGKQQPLSEKRRGVRLLAMLVTWGGTTTMFRRDSINYDRLGGMGAEIVNESWEYAAAALSGTKPMVIDTLASEVGNQELAKRILNPKLFDAYNNSIAENSLEPFRKEIETVKALGLDAAIEAANKIIKEARGQ